MVVAAKESVVMCSRTPRCEEEGIKKRADTVSVCALNASPAFGHGQGALRTLEC
jgi:hypothetical protein